MRGKKLMHDVMVNVAFSGVASLGMFLVVRLCGSYFTPVMLGVFLLSHRISSTCACFCQLGMSQTIVRYLSMHWENSDIKRVYVIIAAMLWAILAGVLIPVFYFNAKGFSNLFFSGEPGTDSLASWTGMAIVSLVAFYISHSLMIAERWMVLANIHNVICSSGFLLIAILWQGDEASPESIVRSQAVMMSVVSLGIILTYLLKASSISMLFKGNGIVGTVIRGFVRFGVPRTLVPFLDMGILSMGPWLLLDDKVQSGYILMSLALIALTGAALGPFVQVISVVTARLVGKNSEEAISEGLRLLFGITLYVSFLVFVFIFPWAETLIRIWLSEETLVSGTHSFFAILAWGIIPFGLFHGLKSFIEMKWVVPLNLITLMGGCGLQLVIFMSFCKSLGTTASVSFAILSSFFFVGFLSLFWIGKYLRPLAYFGIGKLLTLSTVLFVLNTAVSRIPCTSIKLLCVVALVGMSGMLIVRVMPIPFIRDLKALLAPIMMGRKVESL